jgi:hypothetical protein
MKVRVDRMPKPAEVDVPRRFAAFCGNAKMSAIALHRFSVEFGNSFMKLATCLSGLKSGGSDSL